MLHAEKDLVSVSMEYSHRIYSSMTIRWSFDLLVNYLTGRVATRLHRSVLVLHFDAGRNVYRV